MKIGRLFPDLLTTLGRAAEPEVGFAFTLRRLVALSGASAGGLAFLSGRGARVQVTAGTKPGSALDAWIREHVAEPVRAAGVRRLSERPPGWRPAEAPVVFRTSLGDPRRPVGQLLLLGRRGRRGLEARPVPSSFPREFGLAMEQVWRLHERTARLEVLNEVTRLIASTVDLARIYQMVTQSLARLVDFDALAVALLDRERRELSVVEVPRAADGAAAHLRAPARDTLAEWVMSERVPRRVDDGRDPSLPEAARRMLAERGFSSLVVVPLMSGGEVIGTLNVMHREPGRFTDADADVLGEVARPLASAIEQARLHGETARRAEALSALNQTTQLITSRLELSAVLEAISRAVTDLIGSTGCGIGLLNATRSAIEHVAAHGFRTESWRGLSMPVGYGIIGRAGASGTAIRVDDVRLDPRSAMRDVDDDEGIRSMLSVPLRVGRDVIGVISAFSRTAGFFTARDQTLLEAFADQAGIAIQNARLFEESQQRSRQTQALLEAGRAVSQSLDVNETIRVILQQARAVLGVESGTVFTLDEVSGELTPAASLDLDPATVGRIRIRVGEGITGLAVKERRPMQSTDVVTDPRVRHPQVTAASGLRSLLAVPLVLGDRAIGALTVLRADVHHFTAEEQALTAAFADQAAIALEHARLFSSVRTYSERLESMVTERTRQLDEQKRFVEVVLETLPLGLYVLDRDLHVISANPEGARALGGRPAVGHPFLALVPDATVESVRGFLVSVLESGQVRYAEEVMVEGGDARTLRLTGAPLHSPGGGPTHALVLVEDVTLQKRLERQMLLTERLTTAGTLVAGVAHELNNPLATIAGCAEALRERAQDPTLASLDAFKDFPSYLSLIEEEAYRCKEFTSSLLQFVREPGSRRAVTDVNGLVTKTLELLRHQPRFAASQLLTELAPDVREIVANEGQLRQVVLGLAANALEAMEGRGTLVVRTRLRAPGEVEIALIDQGPGIAEDVLPRIFDPFFTTKPPGQGTGLGLAIAQGIVADHGGRIEVTSQLGHGSTFRVLLPVRAEETPA
jgi:two-component system NtrC family sensor kinase